MNIKQHIKYLLLSLAIVSVMTGCRDDELKAEDSGLGNPEFAEGFTLGFSVSLDNMGGEQTRITATYGDDYLREFENYIDVEKFRVLFFDKDDKFLFESKNRFVKKLGTGEVDPTKNEWYVSVPMFTYGNEDAWDWVRIRKALTTGKFKIALLVNRPDKDWYPGFKNTGIDNADMSTAEWIDNTGPNWGPSETGVKDVFDLHHCQYDKIYHAKGASVGYYDFIMEDFPSKPNMGATSSWVDWNGASAMYTSDVKRAFILPSAEHPIPMYGLQEFEPIPDTWKEGTTYVLNRYNDRAISLLRSVVRLELLLPKSTCSDPKFIGICYSNIYARCEPMNNWTPTDQLWEYENGTGAYNLTNCREMNSIMNYGPICRTNDQSTKLALQQRLCWFYGAWLKKGWDFGVRSSNTIKNSDVQGLIEQYKESPNLFNPCVQRNTVVFCDNSKINDNDYYRYVVYTGERNVSDPSDLGKLGDSGSGKPTVMYWMFNQGTKLYAVPLTDYSITNNKAYSIVTGSYSESSPPETHSDINANYMAQVMSMTTDPDKKQLPWPTVRNHVYKIYLGKTRNGDTGTNEDFFITSEDLHSKSITAYPSKRIVAQ